VGEECHLKFSFFGRNTLRTVRVRVVLICLVVGMAPVSGLAAERYSTDELLGFSMQELININVTSVSKHEEKYFETAAALFVITQDDIRRAGARSIPEALRLAPGVEVQRINANQFAISIRGQNDLFADKLLVLMDGRPLYSPTFSGVWWLAQNYPMEDIDHIEVIRGSSGSVWGSNAVNGVINILTKSSEDSQGLMISAGSGSEEKGFATIRFGGETGDVNYRAYWMRENRDGGLLSNHETIVIPTNYSAGQAAPDSRDFTQGGFRIDSERSKRSWFTLQGDIYDMRANAFGTIADPTGALSTSFTHANLYNGHNLMLKLGHGLNEETQITAQLFYDQSHLETNFFDETRTTYDADIQFDFSQFSHHLISIGFNRRNSRGDVIGSPVFRLDSQTNKLDALFLNDDITLIEDRLHLIGGFKYERNQYTGWEFQPQVRMIYTQPEWSLWAAASKAVRIPNMIENGLSLDVRSLGGGKVVRAYGDGSATSEKVTSYEAGVRFHPNSDLLFQATAFRHNHEGISDTRTDRLGAFAENGKIIIPVYLSNYLNGRAIGIEADFTWQVTDWAKLKGAYSYIDVIYFPSPITTSDVQFSAVEMTQQTPHNRYSLGLSLDMSETIELDFNLYHWDRFRRQQGAPYEFYIGAYDRLDARIGWQATDNIQVDLVGKNLLKKSHLESISETLESASLVERSFYIKVTASY